jgi:hypothetical protein
VLINVGWEGGGGPKAAMAGLASLPLPRLCPVGFVFIWADKSLLADVVRQMYKWKYVYVENLTWVMMAPNNTAVTLDSAYVRRSHLTLLMFRKDGASACRPGDPRAAPRCVCLSWHPSRKNRWGWRTGTIELTSRGKGYFVRCRVLPRPCLARRIVAVTAVMTLKPLRLPRVTSQGSRHLDAAYAWAGFPT